MSVDWLVEAPRNRGGTNASYQAWFVLFLFAQYSGAPPEKAGLPKPNPFEHDLWKSRPNGNKADRAEYILEQNSGVRLIIPQKF